MSYVVAISNCSKAASCSVAHENVKSALSETTRGQAASRFVRHDVLLFRNENSAARNVFHKQNVTAHCTDTIRDLCNAKSTSSVFNMDIPRPASPL